MEVAKDIKPRLPIPPYPTLGEIAYEVATRSGLVQTTNDKCPLYNALKAFKDDRKRPSLAPIEFPRTVLVDLEDRLALFWNVEEGDTPGINAALTFEFIRRWFSLYSGIVASRDATLIDRERMVDEVLWPSIFSAGAAVFLKIYNEWKPFVDVEQLITSTNPFGFYLRFLCKNGAADFKAICSYRATKDPNRPIDPQNCRKTLDEWLSGATPNLERCEEILIALKMEQELHPRIWMIVARLLQKTPPKYRTHILNSFKNEQPVDPCEQAFRLTKALAWEIGSKLKIGPDRPYAKIRSVLYEPNSDQPRSRSHVVDMLIRQENTWKPIADETQYIIHWLWGRLHVLCGEYKQGLDRYKLAYDYGANRDPDIYRVAIHEAMILAAYLGEKRQVERFRGWIGLYSSFEWDEEKVPISERFEQLFPSSLRFETGE
jgi:hypothetical protein